MALKVHPIAAQYPAGKERVKASIAEIGQIHPIVMLGDEILDGRGRAEACDELGIEPKLVQYRGKKDWKSLIAYVKAANDHRRHETASQLAMTAYAISQLPDPEKQGDSENEKRINALGQELAAEQLGVSARSVDQASKVTQQGAAAVVEAVKEGVVSVSDAAAISSLPKSDQVAALSKVRSGKSKTLRAATRTGATGKTKPGTQKRTPSDRKNALQLLGKLVRALDKLGLSAGLDGELKAINAALKAS